MHSKRSNNRRNDVASEMWPRVVRMRTALAAGVSSFLLLVAFVTPVAARPPAGQPDPSFGKRGWTEIPGGTAGEETAVDLALAPSGGIVVAEPYDGRIVRLRSDGSLDTRFGERGLLSLGSSTASEGLGGRTIGASAVAVDGIGRVLVFGTQGLAGRSVTVGGTVPTLYASEAVVLRFSRSGSRDRTFGAGKGFIRDDFGLTSPYSSEIPLVGAMTGAVDSRERPLLVSGVASPKGCYAHGGPGQVPRAVVRLTSSGQPDSTFGGDGVVPIEGSANVPELQIDSLDQLAIGVGPIGGSNPYCRTGGAVYRLGRDGDRLAEFGSDGVRISRRMHLSALAPSGAMILSHRQSHTLDLSRLSPDGSPDQNFGQDGMVKVRLPMTAGLEITSVVADRERRIFIAGFVASISARHQPSAFVVARLRADGRLDPRFGKQGWVTTSFPRPLEVTSAQANLDPQGRLVVAGTTVTRKNPDGGFVVARYLTNP